MGQVYRCCGRCMSGHLRNSLKFSFPSCCVGITLRFLSLLSATFALQHICIWSRFSKTKHSLRVVTYSFEWNVAHASCIVIVFVVQMLHFLVDGAIVKPTLAFGSFISHVCCRRIRFCFSAFPFFAHHEHVGICRFRSVVGVSGSTAFLGLCKIC